MNDRAKTDQIEQIVFRYAKGKAEKTDVGWKIRCPFHGPDMHPSCNIFSSGVFYCWSCGAKKGPLEGFRALGVPEEDLSFLGKGNLEHATLIPDLDDIESKQEEQKNRVEILSEEPWPVGWRFRDIPAADFQSGPLFDMFQPKLANIQVGKKKEFAPRIALSFPNIDDPELRVYLRLSTDILPKVMNGPKVGTKMCPLFGYSGGKLPVTCKYIVLVEGPYDAVRLCSHLKSLNLLDNYLVLAILGTHQWDSFLDRFKVELGPQMQGKSVVLAFDNDGPGQDLTEKAVNSLFGDPSLFFSEKNVKILNYKAHDPGEMTKQELIDAIKDLD